MILNIKTRLILLAGTGVLLLLLAGCTTWEFTKIRDLPVQPAAPTAKTCGDCHEERYASWRKTEHADSGCMAKIGVSQMTGCGACHENLAAHTEDPNNVLPPSIAKMNRAEQNKVCGKCHYNRDVFGCGAINPHNRHGLFMSYGFEGFEDTLGCLDCHGGHSTRSDMLQGIQAHVCFKCHKEAIVTMGVFQPLNYLTFGKTCTACHPVHGATAPHQAVRLAAGTLATCFVCHPTGDPSRLWFQKQRGDGNGGGNGGD